MGYYVELTESNWEITESPEALATIQEMPKKFHDLKRGGSSNGEKWFSWMNDASIENTETVENVFNELGFTTEKVDGGFRLTEYNSKTGQEDLFLAVMAPFTKNGSYLEWRGEDGESWKQEIIDGQMFQSEAKTTWTRSKPFAYYHIDFAPGTTTSRTLEIDLSAPADEISNKLDTAKMWNDEREEYYAKMSKERDTQSV